jgi:TfoX N-terminal domain
MAYDETLAARVRVLLAGRPDTVERKMFGGLTFMVGGHMCCGVQGDTLVLRLGPEIARAWLGLRDTVDLGALPATGHEAVLVDLSDSPAVGPEHLLAAPSLGAASSPVIDHIADYPSELAAERGSRRPCAAGAAPVAGSIARLEPAAEGRLEEAHGFPAMKA